MTKTATWPLPHSFVDGNLRVPRAEPAPKTKALIESMLHGDGIPRCKEWEILEAHARTLESDRARLIEALSDSSMWLRICLPSLPNTAVESQNLVTNEYLKIRGLADVVKAVEKSNAALLRELEAK